MLVTVVVYTPLNKDGNTTDMTPSKTQFYEVNASLLAITN